MATTNMMITTLCLSLMVSLSVSQRYFPDYGHEYEFWPRFGYGNPSQRMTQSCSIYNHEKIKQPDEFRGRCTKHVLDKVYEMDEKIYKDKYMEMLFKQARGGMLCYAEGSQVKEIFHACDAMEISCSRYSTPRKIDTCWKIAEQVKPRPPVNPPAAPRPNVPTNPPVEPATPPGRERGI